jgi:hypothetical protein
MQTELQKLEVTPDMCLVISKQNAKDFHNQVKARVLETGDGLMEYVEFVKFITKVDEALADDPEYKDLVRTEIAKYGKETFITARGVKFESAETGTKYDYSKTGDVQIVLLEEAAKEAALKLKKRQEFLKTIPVEGVDLVTEDGEVIHVYPPSKSSTSSFKVTLPK